MRGCPDIADERRLQIAVLSTFGKVRPERHLRPVGRMNGRNAELVSDIVEEVVAVEDDVGLVDREDRARVEPRVSRQVAMREDRDESRDAGKMCAGFTLPIGLRIRSITP